MNKCLRCGQCCYINYNKPCKYLKQIKNKTQCTIYKNRIGTTINRYYLIIPEKCSHRKNSPWDYKNCPYNTNKTIKKVRDD